MQDKFLRLQALINKHAEEYKRLKVRINDDVRIHMTKDQAIDLFEGWLEFESTCWDLSVARERPGPPRPQSITKEDYLREWRRIYETSGGCIHYTPPNRLGSLGAEMFPHVPHFRPYVGSRNWN